MVPLMALFFVVLIGAMAIATDLSVSTHYKRSLQNVTDAAALAGARLLPAAPALADEDAATIEALTLVHNSFPWTPIGGGSLIPTPDCLGTQCSITVCGGMTSTVPSCTDTVNPPNGTQFVLTVNAPPLTAKVGTDNGKINDIEVVMHQKSGAFFTGLFGSSLDQDGAQSVAYHFAANQPFPFALFSSTVIGDGNSPEVIAGNVYASRYLSPQSGGKAAICAAPWVDGQGASHNGFIVIGAPQAPDAGYANDGQSGNSAVGPKADPITLAQNCGTASLPLVGAGVVAMSGNPANGSDCQAAYPGNNGSATVVYDSIDRACEANPAITPPSVAVPPNIPVYGPAQTYCGHSGLVAGVYQPGEYKCSSGTSLTIDAQMKPGIYEIDAVDTSKSPCDVLMDGSTPSTLAVPAGAGAPSGVTFYLKGGAAICSNPASTTTINQTAYNSGSNQPGDGRYAVLSDNVGSPSINMSTAGGGSTSGTWSVAGVIWLPTGTVFISNKDALVDSGQVIVNTWNDKSGNHQNPSVSYNAGLAPPQHEVLQLAE
jgi:Putative Flp pilus-assembly TadE/G-like